MSKHRFFLPSSEWSGESLATLSNEEAHHCRDVMRCQEGDPVAVFDGQGREAEAEIVEITKTSLQLRLLATQSRISAKPAAQITLAQAIPKGKNMELIIQKATELGVSKVVPLLTSNTVIRLPANKEREKKQSKWQRVALEACKQCGQNWLPEISIPLDMPEWIDSCRDDLRIVAAIEEGSHPFHKILNNWKEHHAGNLPASACILIGPEGDFAPKEVEAALQTGFTPMTLGPIILRSETAAIYSVSVLAYELCQR